MHLTHPSNFPLHHEECVAPHGGTQILNLAHVTSHHTKVNNINSILNYFDEAQTMSTACCFTYSDG